MAKPSIRRDELSDIKMVMSTENGRRFMLRLLVRAGLYKTSYVVGSGAEHTAFNEGRRDMGLWTLSELEQADPVGYLKMMEEGRDVE